MHEAGMTDGSRLVFIGGFLPLKIDTARLKRLGYAIFKETFADIDQQLGVNPRSVKNKRDDFDPVFSNGPCRLAPERPGGSRQKVLHLLNDHKLRRSHRIR